MGIRVLIFRDSLHLCGPLKNILYFIKSAGNELSHPTVVYYWKHKRCCPCETMDKIAVKYGVDIRALRQRSKYDLSIVPQAYRLIKEHGTQILESHDTKSHLLCFVLRAITNKPWVAFHHGWITEGFRIRLYSLIDRYIIQLADRVVLVSGSQKNKLDLRLIKHDRISVIPNAVDPDEINAPLHEESGLRKKLGIREGARTVGVVGRLSPEKGQMYLVEAISILLKRNQNIAAVLVGSGKSAELIKSKAEELGIKDSVIFTGHLEDVAPLYRIFDILVIPSLSEGVPNVALEAMLFGKPVIATNVGGVPEIVVDNVTGRLVSPKDPAALAEAIYKMINDRDLIRQYGEAGRARVISEFSRGARAKKILDVYYGVLSRGVIH